jgi:6-phosphofructokinase 2
VKLTELEMAMSAIVTLTMNPALDVTARTERIVAGEKLRCSSPRYDPGGGGINVARALRMLGGNATAVFPIGGVAGQWLEALLEGEDVPRRTIPIDGMTRQNFNIDEQQTGRQFRFIMPGPALSPNERQRCLDQAVGLLPYGGYLVASGSLPPGIPSDFYRHVGDRVSRAGGRFVLDTSGPALCEIGRGNVFLLKANPAELGELLGRRIIGQHAQEDAAREAVSQGYAEFVVLSLGAEGAVLADREGCWRFIGVSISVASTVGAGDSMVAGILHRLVQRPSILEAVRYGMAAGSAALMRPGTELCRMDDVERLFSQIPQPVRRP